MMNMHTIPNLILYNQIPIENQIKYSFWPYQKTPEQIEEKRIEFNDPKWRPAPLAVVNVSPKIIIRNVLNSLIATENCRI